MIIGDTSAWIRMFRRGDAILERALAERRVEVHPFVYGELACGNLRNRRDALEMFGNVRQSPVVPHGIVERFLESGRLFGRGLGWVDMHLLASAVIGNRFLHTHDAALARAAADLGVLAEA